MAFYLDTSALVKLVRYEAETPDLSAWLEATTAPLVTSDLTRTELLRVVRRVAPQRTADARTVLDALILISLSGRTFDAAGLLGPVTLRSLDAVHLATALELGDELEGLVTYDDRMAEAARELGIRAISPGLTRT